MHSSLIPNQSAQDSPTVVRELIDGLGLSFTQAAKLLPPGRNGKPVNPATVWRWCSEGVKAPDGQRVRLEAARVGCRWATSKPALERFLAALNPEMSSPAVEPGRARTAARERQVAQATAELNALGI